MTAIKQQLNRFYRESNQQTKLIVDALHNKGLTERQIVEELKILNLWQGSRT